MSGSGLNFTVFDAFLAPDRFKHSEGDSEPPQEGVFGSDKLPQFSHSASSLATKSFSSSVLNDVSAVGASSASFEMGLLVITLLLTEPI